MNFKIIFLFGLTLMFNSNFSEAKKVKFSVDFGTDSVSILGAHVTGDFQTAIGLPSNWIYDTTKLTNDAGTSIYSVVLDIPAFQKYEYRFVNGEQDYEAEFVPLESQVQYNFLSNRFIYIDSLNTDTMLLAPIRFSTNAPIGKKMIRFKVEMKNQTVSSNGVHVMGDFQGNNPANTRMCPLGSVYHHIAYFDSISPSFILFNYVNGNTITQKEIGSGACFNNNGYRSKTFVADTEIDTVCFTQCTNCFATNLESSNGVQEFKLRQTIFTNNTIQLVFEGQAIKEIQLSMFNQLGKKVHFKKANFTNSIDINTILPSGIYFVKSTINQSIFQTNKLIIQ